MYRQSARLTNSVKTLGMAAPTDSTHVRISRSEVRNGNLKRNSEAIDLIKAAERTNAEVAAYLSRRLGRDVQHYHVSRILTGERKVQSDELEGLREIAASPASAVQAAPVLTGTDEVQPLFGYANGAGQTLRLNEDAIVAVVPLHPAQMGSRQAYAFICYGDSVSTRLQHGDTGYALRNRPPFKNQLCVVRLKNGEALVKFYDGQDGRTLNLYETFPKRAPVPIALRDVDGLDAVVGSTFGPGT